METMRERPFLEGAGGECVLRVCVFALRQVHRESGASNQQVL